MQARLGPPKPVTPKASTRVGKLKSRGERNTRRESQRLLKVDPGREALKDYYGLTFMSMLPGSTQDDLYAKVQLLENELKASGLRHCFLFLPPSTYHITLEDVIERVSPDIEQVEVDHYYDVATSGLTLPTGSCFDVDIQKFSKFTNLVLYAKAKTASPPPFLNQLRQNLGKKPKKSEDGEAFHITVAYYLEPLATKSDERRLEDCIHRATRLSFFTPSGAPNPLRFRVDDGKMYYFSSMNSYEEIHGTSLI